METMYDFVNTALSYIGPFFVLLGLLIFVHEFGHFIVAKYFGVKVETFSLGFGKKIFKFIKGDTTYCISLIPLGGYVKMYGDDPTAEIPPDMYDKAFLKKPVGARIAIVLAGPLMNLFFAALVFSVVAVVGERLPSPIVGDVKPSSPAYEYGFRSGDKILSVNNQTVSTWEEVTKVVKENPNNRIPFLVEREETKDVESFTAKTVLERNDNILSTDRMIGKVKGLTPSSTAGIVGISAETTPALEAGMSRLSLITKINGEEIKYFRHLEDKINSYRGETITISFKDFLSSNEDPPEKTATIDLAKVEGSPFVALGFETTELFLFQIRESSPAQKAGIQPGDKIVKINGKSIQEWEDVVEAVKNYEGDGRSLSFVFAREGKDVKIDVVPEMTELISPNGAEDNRFTVGIVPAIISAYADPVLIKYSSPMKIASYGIEKSWLWTKMVVLSFVRMVQNEVSARNIGGVITIGKYAGQSYKVGISNFLKLMAIISINLFVLNLLPVPILDGGHLLFFTIEAIRGAPLSMKKMEIAQQVGLIILMGLMVFALFNDITNLLNPPW